MVPATTGQRPAERPRAGVMRPRLTCRPTAATLPGPGQDPFDISIRCNDNAYTVPPWMVENSMTIKADNCLPRVYYHQRCVVQHDRS